MNRHQPIILLLLLIIPMGMFADSHAILVGKSHTGGTHFFVPNPAEIPDLYFDDETLSLTIDGSGAVSYYEVTITSATTSLTFLYTVVDGDYDTIDISYLPVGDTYVITLTTPGGTDYEGSIAL